MREKSPKNVKEYNPAILQIARQAMEQNLLRELHTKGMSSIYLPKEYFEAEVQRIYPIIVRAIKAEFKKRKVRFNEQQVTLVPMEGSIPIDVCY